MHPHWLALGAIFLWATLAPLGVALSHVPPFLLTGLALLIGSVIALPLSGWRVSRWKVAPTTLALGVYGLFGFHLLLFMALRNAPAVEANLVNYLWPLLMVVLAPFVLPGVRFKLVHLMAALMGFAGAAIAILGDKPPEPGFSLGYLSAAASALVWASYSLLSKRVAAFPTAAVGSFAALSGALSLVCHLLLERPTSISVDDWALIAILGLGPLGSAFFLWDAALKRGDPRKIGLLAFLTPLLSTLLLLLSRGQTPSPAIVLAAALVASAAAIGTRSH